MRPLNEFEALRRLSPDKQRILEDAQNAEILNEERRLAIQESEYIDR